MCIITSAENTILRVLTDEDKNSLNKWLDRELLCAGIFDCYQRFVCKTYLMTWEILNIYFGDKSQGEKFRYSLIPVM